ncbi:MAG: hypothetical protein Q8Q33_07730, partial [Chlamydiota bacterium]|nr:hypothetical protein [Chlamydiota bacterium]
LETVFEFDEAAHRVNVFIGVKPNISEYGTGNIFYQAKIEEGVVGDGNVIKNVNIYRIMLADNNRLEEVVAEALRASDGELLSESRLRQIRAKTIEAAIGAQASLRDAAREELSEEHLILEKNALTIGGYQDGDFHVLSADLAEVESGVEEIEVIDTSKGKENRIKLAAKNLWQSFKDKVSRKAAKAEKDKTLNKDFVDDLNEALADPERVVPIEVIIEREKAPLLELSAQYRGQDSVLGRQIAEKIEALAEEGNAAETLTYLYSLADSLNLKEAAQIAYALYKAMIAIDEASVEAHIGFGQAAMSLAEGLPAADRSGEEVQGLINQRASYVEEAKNSFEKALKLDSGNSEAARGLEELKKLETLLSLGHLMLDMDQALPAEGQVGAYVRLNRLVSQWVSAYKNTTASMTKAQLGLWKNRMMRQAPEAESALVLDMMGLAEGLEPGAPLTLSLIHGLIIKNHPQFHGISDLMDAGFVNPRTPIIPSPAAAGLLGDASSSPATTPEHARST